MIRSWALTMGSDGESLPIHTEVDIDGVYPTIQASELSVSLSPWVPVLLATGRLPSRPRFDVPALRLQTWLASPVSVASRDLWLGTVSGEITSVVMLRGLHDTKVPMAFALFGYWVAGMGTAVGLGFGLGWDGVGIWGGLAAGLAVVAVLMIVRWVQRERLGLTAGAVRP